MQKILCTLALLFTINFAYAQYPTFEDMGEYSIAEMEALLDDLGIPQAFIEKRFAVKAHKVTYQTMHPATNELTLVTGVIVVPQGSACDFPLSCYVHGTTATKSGVASHGSAELNIGLIFSMLGNVVVMPDLIGLGDSPGLHPYHHAESTATCSIDLMRVARDHADELGIKLNDQLFTFGYSQGGHGAMAVHKYIEENLHDEFTVTASVPMSGAYDISGVQAQTVIADSTYDSPGYLPYIIFGLNQIYDLFDDPIEVFVEPYATTLPLLFDGETGFDIINDVMPDTPNQVLQPAVLEDFINNPDSEFRAAFAEQDVYDWTPTAPIRMMYCTDDEQVFYENALVAEAQFIENGVDPELAKAINLGHLTHGGCVEPALIGGKFYFAEMAVIYNGIEHEADVVLPSESFDDNGSITITATGGEGDLSYQWSTGQNGPVIENLPAGIYQLTISDAADCEVTTVFDMLNVASDELAVQELAVFPNPASDVVNIDLPESAESYTVSLRDVTGREVFGQSNVQGASFAIDVQNFTSGAYVMHLHNSTSRYMAKLLVK